MEYKSFSDKVKAGFTPMLIVIRVTSGRFKMLDNSRTGQQNI